MDTESGLVSMRARMYDPKLGRFTQTDPIVGNRPADHFAYAGNTPTQFRDPTGKYLELSEAEAEKLGDKGKAGIISLITGLFGDSQAHWKWSGNKLTGGEISNLGFLAPSISDPDHSISLQQFSQEVEHSYREFGELTSASITPEEWVNQTPMDRQFLQLSEQRKVVARLETEILSQYVGFIGGEGAAEVLGAAFKKLFGALVARLGGRAGSGTLDALKQISANVANAETRVIRTAQPIPRLEKAMLESHIRLETEIGGRVAQGSTLAGIEPAGGDLFLGLNKAGANNPAVVRLAIDIEQKYAARKLSTRMIDELSTHAEVRTGVQIPIRGARVGASRPICPECMDFLNESGALPVTPPKE